MQPFNEKKKNVLETISRKYVPQDFKIFREIVSEFRPPRLYPALRYNVTFCLDYTSMIIKDEPLDDEEEDLYSEEDFQEEEFLAQTTNQSISLNQSINLNQSIDLNQTSNINQSVKFPLLSPVIYPASIEDSEPKATSLPTILPKSVSSLSSLQNVMRKPRKSSTPKRSMPLDSSGSTDLEVGEGEVNKVKGIKELPQASS